MNTFSELKIHATCFCVCIRDVTFLSYRGSTTGRKDSSDAIVTISVLIPRGGKQA